MKKNRLLKTSVHILLMAVIILYIFTGYGITNYHIVESITFFVLSKPISHLIHSNLIIPFIILLIFHIILSTKTNYLLKLFRRFRINERKN